MHGHIGTLKYWLTLRSHECLKFHTNACACDLKCVCGQPHLHTGLRWSRTVSSCSPSDTPSPASAPSARGPIVELRCRRAGADSFSVGESDASDESSSAGCGGGCGLGSTLRERCTGASAMYLDSSSSAYIQCIHTHTHTHTSICIHMLTHALMGNVLSPIFFCEWYTHTHACAHPSDPHTHTCSRPTHEPMQKHSLFDSCTRSST